MGKVSRWFRRLICLTKHDSHNSPSMIISPNHKCCWNFLKSYKDNPQLQLNNSAGTQQWAAIKIQAAFRACLARRALQALKGLVMLQALVRGEIDRKKMQAFLLAQARAARAQISQASRTAKPSSTTNLHGPATPDKFESSLKSVSMKYDQSSSVLKRNGSKSRALINGNGDKCGNKTDNGVDGQAWNQPRSWTRTCSMDVERSVKIHEIDSRKLHITSKRRNLFHSTSQPLVCDHYSQSLTTTKDSTSYQSCQSPSSCEVQSYSPQNLCTSSNEGDSKRSPFTPTMSDRSKTHLSGNSDYPSYMAYTESSKAKVRANSAPKQRPYYERSNSSNRHTLH